MTLKRFIALILIIFAWHSGFAFGRLSEARRDLERWLEHRRKIEDGLGITLACPSCKREMLFK